MSTSYEPYSRDGELYQLTVKTNLGDRWIKIRKSHRYRPYYQQQWHHSNSSEQNLWTIVNSKKDQPIHYWNVLHHNIHDQQDGYVNRKSTDEMTYQLCFIEPNLDVLEVNDQSESMAIDAQGQLHHIYSRLKHGKIKMQPMFFIARNLQQITECLKHVKYCTVQVINHEQRLIEGPNQQY